MTTGTISNAAKPWPRLGVFKLGDGSWMVPSRTTEGAYWRVTFETGVRDHVGFACTCPAGRDRGRMGSHDSPPCRHVRQVSLAEQEDGYAPRPTPAPNVSALVD